jgi:hypothetical protein
MDSLGRLARILPTGDSAPAIARLRAGMADQDGDALAISHIQLYDAYIGVAKKRPYLSGPFRRLARYHVEKAVVCAKVWSKPWALLGALQLDEGDLGAGLKNLATSIAKQRFWLQHIPPSEGFSAPDDSERLEFCRRLALGAGVRCQLGQFAAAREWFTEALEEFKRLETKTRIAENDLEGGIILGISGCMLLEYRFSDAKQLIDMTLADEVFSAYPSSAHQKLAASKELLGELPEITRDFQLPTWTQELWSSLMDDIEACETPEAARSMLRRILATIRTHDANAEIQPLAIAAVKVMKRVQSILGREDPPPTIADVPNAKEVDLSSVGDPEMRKLIEDMMKAVRAQREAAEKLGEDIREAVRPMRQAALRIGRRNIAVVSELADQVDSVPLRYRVEWRFWGIVRFVVQINAVAYFLEKILIERDLEKALKQHGEVLFHSVSPAQKDAIVAVAVLVVGFVLGHFAEKHIDDCTLPKYKNLLSRIVSDRSSGLWVTYNTLLKVLDQTKEGLSEIEKRMRDGSGERQSPG